MPSIYKEKNGKWTCAFYVPIKGELNARGKQKQKRAVERGFTKKTDAEAWYRDNHEPIASGVYLDVQKLTVAQWMRRWHEVYCAQLAPATKRSYSNSIDKHIVPHIGGLLLRDLRPDIIQAFVNALSSAKRTLKSAQEERPYAPGMIRQVFACLDAALRRAVDDDLLAKNPCRRTTLPEMPRPERAYCTAEQLQSLLERLRGTDYYAPVLFCVTLGMRRGEALGLTWGSVDFEAGTLKVCAQLLCGRGGPRLAGILKTSSSYREHEIPSALVDLLRSLKRKQAENKLAAGPAYQNDGFVFADILGRPLNPDSVSRAVGKALDGIATGLSMHDLRHSCATLMRESGVRIEVVSAILGHSDVQTTQKYYVGDQKSAQREAIEAIAKILKV